MPWDGDQPQPLDKVPPVTLRPVQAVTLPYLLGAEKLAHLEFRPRTRCGKASVRRPECPRVPS